MEHKDICGVFPLSNSVDNTLRFLCLKTVDTTQKKAKEKLK